MLGKIKKQKLLILSLALVLLIGAGSTIAYLISVPPGVENKFQPTVVSCTVLEDFDKQTKSNVRVQNTGDIDAYIRAEIVVNWKNDAGEVYGAEPKAGADYNIDIPENTGWFEKGGFYYYENVVDPKGTRDLIRESHTRLIHRSIPNSRLAIIPGDHGVAALNPGAFNAVVLDFLLN